MKKSKVKKNTAILIIITALLLLLSAAATHMAYHAENKSKTAYIYRGDDLLQIIDLNSVAKTYTIDLVADDGHINTVEVRNGEIGIISADCPDKICVKTGFIGDGVMPIVCVPNKIMIVVRDDGGQIDAQT